MLRSGKTGEQTRRGFRFGQYSDDSQLARALLQSYVARAEFDPSDYAARIAAIFAENRIVGHGFATEEAACRLIEGVPWQEAGSEPPHAGNGSAMRAAPIGLLFFDNPRTMIQAAHDQSRITHKDRRCSAGAVAIAGAAAMVLQIETVEPTRFSSRLSGWANPFDSILAEALEHRMPEWVKLTPEGAAAQISRAGLPPDYSDEWQGISPFVTSSVLWALYSFLRNPDNYWEAVCTAIAVGGDVDTTAAMTGAISGTRLGLENLPAGFARLLNDKGSWKYDELNELAQRAFSIKTGKVKIDSAHSQLHYPV
jgi:ADP-ribosylglycohydrolase